MPRNATIEQILAMRDVPGAYRVLSCDLAWPTPYSEPPFSSGCVSVPALTTNPPSYNIATFNAAVWTDVTALVSSFQYTQDLDQQCDALSLSVPENWASTDLDRVFRAMRAIVIQERYAHGTHDTGWIYRCWCLSTGYTLRWDSAQGIQLWTVNALDALALAGMDVLASAEGSVCYQPDVIEIGGSASNAHASLFEVDDVYSDAWEYAVVDAADRIYPNWADRPGPQFWCHNVPGASDPIPLAVGGDAVQAVFGEGVLRVSKAWARANVGSNKDYSAGLGFDDDERPDIRGHLWRFAQPGIENRDLVTVASDITPYVLPVSDPPVRLTQIASPPVDGYVTVAGDLSSLPQKLTLLTWDGTGARHATTGHTYNAVSNTTTFTLSLTTTVPTDTPVQYGDANCATDLVRRWLIESGYQVNDPDAPLYATAPDEPTLQGEVMPLIIPPLVYHDTDKQTRLQALADLRNRYAVIPSWITRASDTGQIITNTVQQQFDDETGPTSDVLPVELVAEASADKTDLNVFTRVVARGTARQVTDLMDLGRPDASSTTILDVPTAAGGLPTLVASGGHWQTTYNGTTYQINVAARRGDAGGDSDYDFYLADLGSRAIVPSLNHRKLRPWAWGVQEAEGIDGSTPAFDAFKSILPDAWANTALCEITFASPQEISSLTLLMPNPWQTSTNDWLYHGASEGSTAQVIRVDYWDAAQGRFLPLTEDITTEIAYPYEVTVNTDAFVSRANVTTTKLRLICVRPFVGWRRYLYATAVPYVNQFYRIATIGVYLWQLKVYNSGVLRGIAEIGSATGFAGAAWESARARFRRRTYVVDDVADWANSQSLVDKLALDWLYEVTRNLAPRTVQIIRPDVRLGDTVRVPLPNGQVVCYPDTGNLTDWRLYGVTSAQSDDLLLYWSLEDVDGERVVTLYRDSARQHSVCRGSRGTDGVVSLSALPGYAICGCVTVAYTEDTQGTVAPPTYLVTGVEHGGEGGSLSPTQCTLVNYRDPYFEED